MIDEAKLDEAMFSISDAIDNLYEIDSETVVAALQRLAVSIADEAEMDEDTRLRLDLKAMSAYPESSTLTEAITKYLAKLDPHSLEWEDWIEVYTEGKLANYFGVQI